MSESAREAASAALRELPEALVLVFDQDLRFLLTAGRALARFGNPAAYREGQPLEHAFPAELWRRIEPLCRSALRGETRSREVWSAGQRHCLMLDVGPLHLHRPDYLEDPGPPDIAGGVAVVLDITRRRQADLLTPEPPTGSFEEVFDFAPIGTALLDTEGRFLLVNRALSEITGYTAEELIGRGMDAIAHPEDEFNDVGERARLLAGEVPALQVERRCLDAAGETLSVILSMSLLRSAEGLPLHYIAQLQDISERKRMEEHLRHLADHDPLTGLRNRRLFEHDLQLQVARSRRYGEIAGLIVVDLDHFKAINDSFGHQAGDEALKLVARAFTRRLRETDLVARLGGDEFAVLLPHIDREGLAVVCEGLTRVIAACTVEVGDEVLHPTASIGFSVVEEQTRSAEQALRQADLAMYAVKRAKGASRG